MLFLRNKENKDTFNMIHNIRLQAIKGKRQLIQKEINYVKNFEIKIIKLMASLLDIYFVYRLFKRATNRKPDLPKIALMEGESTTHLIGYLGLAHIKRIAEILEIMNFSIINQHTNELVKVNINGEDIGEYGECLHYSCNKE